jgi:hypothetical protein
VSRLASLFASALDRRPCVTVEIFGLSLSTKMALFVGGNQDSVLRDLAASTKDTDQRTIETTMAYAYLLCALVSLLKCRLVMRPNTKNGYWLSIEGDPTSVNISL